MKNIIGRQAEIKELTKALNSNEAEFIAVYGRRRIGKTWLIDNFFENAKIDPTINKKIFYYSMTATFGDPTAKSISRFSESIDLKIGKVKYKKPVKWDELFTKLSLAINLKINEFDKVVVFLDEFPWFHNPPSDFLSSFIHWWQNTGVKNEKLILVISGSSVSWIIRNVIKNRKDLHDRVTIDMPLQPFNLKETYDFLTQTVGFNPSTLDKKEVIELYMTMGGIPKYLKKLDPGDSIHSNIQNMFFTPDKNLNREYEVLLKGLFDEHLEHKSVLDLLSNFPEGKTINEIKVDLNKESFGNFYLIIDDLEKTGFICKRNMFKPKNKTLYKLCDPYIIFHKKWVEPFNNQKIEDKEHWIKIKTDNDFSKWAGLAFENICFKYIEEIKRELGISSVKTTCSSLRVNEKNEKGSQIDIIIQRGDKYVNLCECKFYSVPWNIKESDKINLENKTKKFTEITKIEKNIIPILISVYGAKDNANFRSCFKKSILAEDIFFK